MVDAIDATGVLDDLGFVGDLVVGDEAVPFLQRNDHLLPGQVGAEAAVWSGTEADMAWPRRVEADFGPDVRCGVIGIADLIVNKKAAGRPQDLADVDGLERLLRTRR